MAGKTNGAADPAARESEAFDGLITVRLGGVDKGLRPLPITKNRAWKARLAERIRGALDGFEARDWPGIYTLAAGLVDEQVELLIAYDVEGRLGGREWIEANATEREIYEAFKAILEEAFPPLADARRFPRLVGELLPQLLASSGSSPSPSGADPAAS